MKCKHPFVSIASATVLSLALGQGVLAAPASGESPAPSAGPASSQAAPAPNASAEAPATEPKAGAAAKEPAASPESEYETAHERMEKKRSEMMEARKRRYEELRERAAEVGLELPETPPWEQAGMEPPEMPTPPWKAMSSEERQAEWEKMRKISAEERAAMREKRWEELRERAKNEGFDLPETPPWKQAQERREAMRAKWAEYRKLVDDMSPEQKEAARAIFGRGGRPMPVPMPVEAPCERGYNGPSAMPPRGMMSPYRGGQGPAMYKGRPAAPWYGGMEPGRQAAPPRGYNPNW
jgi:hypothetical protein